MVFFEAPHRLADFLADAAGALGEAREGVICRELTKPHEEVIRGTLDELVAWCEDGVRGEVTLVIAGAGPAVASAEDALELVRRRMAEGEKLSAAVSEVAAMTGTNRKQLYQSALKDRNS